MRRPPRCLVLLTVVLLSPAPFPAQAAAPLPEPVAQALKRHSLPTRGLSLYVHEVGGEQPLLAFDADAARNPASTIKLLTTLAALEELGPAYAWKTEAWAAAPVRDGRLAGDLTLKGYGDPFLVIEHFWRFLRALRQHGLQTIAGDLVLDQGYFASEPGDPAGFDNRPTRAYNVLPAALLVNFQAVNFHFSPDLAADRLRIVADPRPWHLEIENRVRLTHEACRGWGGHLGFQLARQGEREKATFSGRYDAACGDNDLFRVVTDPVRYVHGVFRTMWQELGGSFEGGGREGSVPADARPLYTWYSPPLADIIRSINKYSNNVMTRQLLLTLGAERRGAPGTTEKGIQAVREWLARRGLDFPELVLDNGAGLSREERISARHLGALLLAGYRSPYMPEFLSSLAIPAQDGTLRHRLSGSRLEGQAHLKTGSLNNVRALAGYVLDHQGRRVAVVSLHNHPQADTPAGLAVQDALLEWVASRP